MVWWAINFLCAMKKNTVTPHTGYTPENQRLDSQNSHVWKEMKFWKPSFLVSMLHPRKLTWNLKMMVFHRNLLFQGFIFRFHVSFRGCRFREDQAFLTKAFGGNPEFAKGKCGFASSEFGGFLLKKISPKKQVGVSKIWVPKMDG